ncbi:MAG: hypothetical protein ACI8TL_001518, partial [Natronomonas sp.]
MINGDRAFLRDEDRSRELRTVPAARKIEAALPSRLHREGVVTLRAGEL